MKKKSISQVSLLFLCITYSCTQISDLREASPISVQVSEDRLLRIDKMLQQSIDSGWIAGAVGFIARDGKIIYNKSFGINDTETQSPLRSDNIFRIASQTKAITCVAVMMLFEEGKILLDDRISKYIKEFANPKVLDQFNEKDTTYTTVPAYREITIRDLLTHTSGIDYAVIGSKNMRAIYAKSDIPMGFVSNKIILGDKIRALGKLPLAHQPGEKFTYGLNLDVLGYLVEVVSGESLNQYFQKHIFDPLGMTDTYFYLPPSKFNRLVKVYTEDKNHHLSKLAEDTMNYPLVKGTYFSGGAGLCSTTKDYAVFLQMLLNKGEYKGKRLLSRHTVDLMTSNQIGDLYFQIGSRDLYFLAREKIGFGFTVTTADVQAKLGVSEGSFTGGGYFATTFLVDPKERIVSLLYMQQSPFSHSEIPDKFKALVYQALND
jgi:CubicO group peptidase (beta-lactamase class C family)